MAEPTAVAVLGTGIMGGAMARRWAEHGFDVTVWNRSREKAEPLSEAGARMAESPAEAVKGADVIVTMLADGDITESVVEDARSGIEAGALWVQMATVGVKASERLAATAADLGLRFVDAPVSGTKGPAEQGKLNVYASGPDDVHDECAPLFDVVAAKVTWVGAAGAGSRFKLVINHWLAALLAGLAESIALAEALDIDPADFLDAIGGGPLGPPYARLKGDMMVERSYPASFPLHLLTKDVGLVAEAAGEAGLQLRLPAAIRDLLVAASPTTATTT